MAKTDTQRMIDVIKACSKVLKDEIDADPTRPWDYMIVAVPVNRSGELPFVTSVPEERIDKFLAYLVHAATGFDRSIEYLDAPSKVS